MFKLSNSSVRRLEGVDHRLITIINEALKTSKIDFGIPAYGGLRTEEEQLELFLADKSKADGVSNKSYHQTGLAFDVYAYVDGKASWEPLHLATVASAMLQAAAKLGYKLQWGGLWVNFVDMPHFQLEY